MWEKEAAPSVCTHDPIQYTPITCFQAGSKHGCVPQPEWERTHSLRDYTSDSVVSAVSLKKSV